MAFPRQQKRLGCNRPGNNFSGASGVKDAADASRAASRGQPERHAPVMQFGAEMLVAVQAKSMLK